jgi:hypothetical protein
MKHNLSTCSKAAAQPADAKPQTLSLRFSRNRRFAIFNGGSMAFIRNTNLYALVAAILHGRIATVSMEFNHG